MFYRKCCQIFSMRKLSTSNFLCRTRAEWRLDRKPANTRLSTDDIVEKRKAFGGRSKLKAVEINSGYYLLSSKNLTKNLKIVDVVHSDAGQHYRQNKIMSKGTIVTVDISTLKSDLADTLSEEHLGRENLEHVKELIESDLAYAKVTSRPGQVGCADGYILEGNELALTVNKLRDAYSDL